MTRFEEFARSPYFNKHQELAGLIAYLSKVYPEFSPKTCDRAKIWQALFPTLPHDQPRLAVLFTYAQRLFRQFVEQEQAETAGFFNDNYLYVNWLRSRKANLFLEKYLTKKNNGVRKNKQANQPYAIPNLLGLIAQTEEYDRAATALGQQRMDFLLEKQAYLDCYFVEEKLRDGCELLIRSRLTKVAFLEGPALLFCLETARSDMAQAQGFTKAVIYAMLYNLLKTNEISAFDPTLQTIQQFAGLFTSEELQNSYNQLQNFCIEQINRGQQAFLEKLFQLYQVQLSSGLLIVDGRLPEWHYKNIVTTGLRLGESAWVGRFLEEYKPLLEPNVAENAYSYNLAALNYHTGNLDAVLRLLVQVDYTDLRYHLDAKSLLLRTYFDLEEEEALLSLVEAFKQYLKRNKQLTDFQKQGYFNLLKFARKAFQLKMSQGVLSRKKWLDAQQSLVASVEAAPTVFNKSWLLEKISDF